MERNIRINWEAITAEARRRREARSMTQRHLAALAKVSRSTLSRFENNSGDVQLSSVLRVLNVLDMVDRKQEGSLLLRHSDGGDFSVSFAPNFGPGGAMEAKVFGNESELREFLMGIGLTDSETTGAFNDLKLHGVGRVPHVSISLGELQEIWPVQFGQSSIKK
jgi:transcriptional regulator with XRE-family HTH domain